VTFTAIECVNDPEVPVTISVKVEGFAEEGTLTVRSPHVTLSVTFMELEPNVADTPLGGVETVNTTGELKRLIPVSSMQAVADIPAVRVNGGYGAIAKSLTTINTVVVRVSAPETPVMVSVNDEGVTDVPTVTVKMEDAEPPAGGLMEGEEKVADMPAGGVDTLKVTGEVTPLIEVAVTEAVADPATLTRIGEIAPIAKS
jgi:hypothetical protein